MKRHNKKKSANQKTTFLDFLIVLGSGFVNLLKIEKIICIIILYLLARDFYFSRHLEDGEIYQKNILDAASLLQQIINSGDNKDFLYLAIIFVLCFIIITLIVVINTVYKREISRLTRERSRLMHDMGTNTFTTLREHRSSEHR